MVLNENLLYFSWLDYSLFISVLLISALIGVYFGFFGKKQDSRQEYMHGGRTMKVLPIAASLVATDISGITLLAVPADIYLMGSSFWLCIISGILTAIIVAYVYLPVFFKLKLNSSFEYLRLRFDSRVCVAASATFLLTVIAFMPIIIYIPALAFSQVSGVNLNIVIPIVCIICIFYTTIGGIKAVVWTDTIQMIIMLGSMITVVTLGIVVGGGFVNIWNTNLDGDRIDFNLDPDITNRTSGIAVIIGLLATYCGYGNNPVYIQRFLALPSYEHAKKTILIFCIGSTVFKSFSVIVGLIMYARYAGCDPISSGLVDKPDQIVPYYVMDISSSLPGLSGLFIAGIFCAALSTMSSGLNTLAGTIYEDFMANKMPKDITEKRISDIMKVISVVLGLVCMVFVFLVQYLGALFQLTLKVTSLAGGPILAMFSLGMLVPFVNTKGILYGVLGGIVTVGWLLFGAIYYELTGRLKPHYKPLSVDQCEFNVTQTFFNTTTVPDEDLPFYPYQITFYYYGLIGAIITTLIAIPISIFSGGDEQIIDRDLLSPIIYPYISDKHKPMTTTTPKQEEDELKTLNVVKVDPITKIRQLGSGRRKENGLDLKGNIKNINVIENCGNVIGKEISGIDQTNTKKENEVDVQTVEEQKGNGNIENEKKLEENVNRSTDTQKLDTKNEKLRNEFEKPDVENEHITVDDKKEPKTKEGNDKINDTNEHTKMNVKDEDAKGVAKIDDVKLETETVDIKNEGVKTDEKPEIKTEDIRINIKDNIKDQLE